MHLQTDTYQQWRLPLLHQDRGGHTWFRQGNRSSRTCSATNRTAQHMSLHVQRTMSAVDALGAQAVKQGSRSGEAVFQIAGALQKGGLPHGEQVIRPISAATPPTGKGSPG